MTTFDAVGFGALNVDTLFKVNKIASAEEESFIMDFKEVCGGSAANTMVGLARLGCKVGFIGKVAHDREGKMLIEDFHREGVDTGGVIIAKRNRSGKTLGFVDRKGQRALYVDPGINDTIDFEKIDIKYAYQTSFLHLTSFVGEESFQAQKELVNKLPENVKLSLDPGELYARKGAKLKPIMEKAFIVMPNLTELEILTGTSDYKEGAKGLLKMNVKIAAVKLGEKGCYVTDGKESHKIETFKVRAIDTTGAGDAFCAGFLHGLISDKNLYECGRAANFVASRCIMKTGARNGLPRLAELTEKLTGNSFR